MKIHFNLKNQKGETSAVLLIVTHKGEVYRKYTGISVKTNQWKKTKRDGQWPTDPKASLRLREIKSAIESRADEFSSASEVKLAIEEALSGSPSAPAPKATVTRPSFWEYFREWSQRPSAVERQRRSNCKTIAELMGDREDWEDIDESYLFRLTRKMESKGFSKNYQGIIISRLRTVMSEGYKMKYHRSEAYRQFKRMSEQPDTVYLTEEEVESLWNLELTGKMERDARDLFLVGVYTAARFSDYSRLSEKNISNGFISFTQRKTSDSVVVPLSPKVAAILERNGGHAPKMNQIVFNREIKKVCEKAGLVNDVRVTRSRGASHVTEYVPKWKLVSSHTARRTGATLLYKAGVSTRQCMLITGHKNEQSFRKYIRITKEENAALLADNPFFK